MKSPREPNRRAALAASAALMRVKDSPPTGFPPGEFRQFIERELARWRPVVRASGFSLDE
jgi:tripartite-type tricarboxylate transporter receptor subunit TctC